MQAREIEEMAQLESEHWWYRGLRDMIRRTVRMPRMQVPIAPSVLDAGCGTGANLQLLQDVLRPGYAGGFDISPDAVRLCHDKTNGADVYVSDLRDPEIHVDSLDLVLSCDVVSLAGVNESKAGLARLVQRLRIGGVFILNVAAFRWMYSSHDVITRTRDRMTAGDVRQLFDDLSLTVELITYRVFSLFPAVVAARLPSMLRQPALEDARTDLKRSTPMVNDPLARVLCAENWAVAKGLRFPWGSSVYAVGRRF